LPAAAGKVADLIEEQRAASGGFESPGAGAGAGECAGFSTKQLGFDQVVWQSAEVHLEIRGAATRGASALPRAAELACTMSASTSLPAPFGPVMRTGTSA